MGLHENLYLLLQSVVDRRRHGCDCRVRLKLTQHHIGHVPCAQGRFGREKAKRLFRRLAELGLGEETLIAKPPEDDPLSGERALRVPSGIQQ
jgi:hypothetical protein